MWLQQGKEPSNSPTKWVDCFFAQEENIKGDIPQKLKYFIIKVHIVVPAKVNRKVSLKKKRAKTLIISISELQ